jgi:hypothetical protein
VSVYLIPSSRLVHTALKLALLSKLLAQDNQGRWPVVTVRKIKCSAERRKLGEKKLFGESLEHVRWH